MSKEIEEKLKKTLTSVELKNILHENGLPVSGNKDTLANRISEKLDVKFEEETPKEIIEFSKFLVAHDGDDINPNYRLVDLVVYMNEIIKSKEEIAEKLKKNKNNYERPKIYKQIHC